MAELPDLSAARSAPPEDLAKLIYDVREPFLLALLDNPRLDESHLILLLDRADLPAAVLEAVARRRKWQKHYDVRRRIVFHRHTPRLTAFRLARELYLMDLVQLSLLPAVQSELRRLAEELILSRLPQIPLGQKMALARRASGRVASGLIAEGHARVARTALDNPFLNEAQILRPLSNPKLPAEILAGVARHRKWSTLPNVRLAVMRHPLATPGLVLGFVRDISSRDLDDLAQLSSLSPAIIRVLRAELARRAEKTASAS